MKRFVPVLALVTIALVLLVLARPGRPVRADEQDAPPAVALGEPVGDLRFLDIRYLRRGLDDLGERSATVLVFITTDCPIARRYLPRLVELERAFSERGVLFVAVGVGPGDSIIDLAACALDAGIEFPVVQDPGAAAAARLGVTRTPEAVVLDGDDRLVYRGRIDRQYRVGGVAPDEGRADLRLAIEDALAGRPVEVAATEVDGCLITVPEPSSEPAPTWAADVAPILQASCQRCHRDGGEGPFSLVGYEAARDNAAMIAEVVEQGRMPPWFADPRHGTFLNDPTLDAASRRTILRWATGGAPSGDLETAPAPLEWPVSEWRIDAPDLVLRVPSEVRLPADGYVKYKYATLHLDMILPHVFTEDTWVQQVEIRPSNRPVLHHANLFYRHVAKEDDYGFISGQVPGGEPMRLMEGVAFKIPAGSVLGLQMHYVTTGVPETDRISVGIRFARGTVEKELRHFQVTDRKFVIPAGARAHEVTASRTLPRDSTGLGMFSHMHLRGRDMRFLARTPDGRQETLLLIPNYSFDWQLAYAWERGAKRFPAGTEIEVVAHYDNTAFNPYNPDPSEDVRFGNQTHHEMMYGFFFYIEDEESLELEIDPTTGRVLR